MSHLSHMQVTLTLTLGGILISEQLLLHSDSHMARQKHAGSAVDEAQLLCT